MNQFEGNRPKRRLVRRPAQGKLGGVCAGLADYLDADEALVRAAWARLARSQTDRRIAGVCGGLAEYFDVDPTIVRVGWVIVSIIVGAVVFGVVAYVVAWFIIPQAPIATLHTSPSTT